MAKQKNSANAIKIKCVFNKYSFSDIGCGSVGSAADSDTKCQLFESSHWKIFTELIFTVNCNEKTAKE